MDSPGVNILLGASWLIFGCTLIPEEGVRSPSSSRCGCPPLPCHSAATGAAGGMGVLLLQVPHLLRGPATPPVPLSCHCCPLQSLEPAPYLDFQGGLGLGGGWEEVLGTPQSCCSWRSVGRLRFLTHQELGYSSVCPSRWWGQGLGSVRAGYWKFLHITRGKYSCLGQAQLLFMSVAHLW